MRKLLFLSVIIALISLCSKIEDVKILNNVPPPYPKIDLF